MAATHRCSECGGNLTHPGVSSMHMAGVQGGLVCGVTSKLGHVDTGIAAEQDSLTAARIEAVADEVGMNHPTVADLLRVAARRLRAEQ